MPYPEFRAGQRITASLLNAGKLEYVINAAGAQTNATTTVAAATDLSFDVEANAVYLVQARLSFGGTNTVDAKVNWTVPSGATMQRNIIAASETGTTNEDTNAIFIRRGASTQQESGIFTSPSVTAFNTYWEDVWLVVGATAGTVQANFAAVNAGTATLNADSYITYQRVA